MAEYLNTDNHPIKPPDSDFTDFDITIRSDHALHVVTCNYAGRDTKIEFRIIDLYGAFDAALAKKRAQIEQSRATVARLTDKLQDMAANSTATPPPAS